MNKLKNKFNLFFNLFGEFTGIPDIMMIFSKTLFIFFYFFIYSFDHSTGYLWCPSNIKTIGFSN